MAKKKIFLMPLAVLGFLAIIWFSAEQPADKKGGEEAGPGWTVELRDKGYSEGKNAVVFSVRDGRGRALRGPLVTVTVRGVGGRGRTYGGFETTEGVFRADVEFFGAGQWDVSVYVFLNGLSMTVEERVLVGN